jgi:putative ABC transport system substrate-binding protein
MDRRRFLLTCLAGALAVPLGAEAQQAKIYRVGQLLQTSPPLPGGNLCGLACAKLRELGYSEGRNLIVERRWAGGRNELFPSLAAELVALKPDVIVADSTPAALAAKRATTSIPIVMVNVSDPVGNGIVASLARPGGNVTGFTDFGMDLAVKDVDLMHNLVPKASRIAVLMSENPVHPLQLKLIQDAARRVPLTVLPTMVKTEADLEEAFASMVRQGSGAIIWLGGAPISTPSQVSKCIELAAKTKLPMLFPGKSWPERGGLISYAPTSKESWEGVAIYIAKILKGAKPADLPVEQPTSFELVINLKTAKALGLTIPPSLLARADQVIE